MLESIFQTTAATVSLQNCLICIGVAILLGIVISAVHKATTKTTTNFFSQIFSFQKILKAEYKSFSTLEEAKNAVKYRRDFYSF